MEGSVQLCIVLLFVFCVPLVRAQSPSTKPLFSAIYVFGDSTVDAGNNNHRDTLAKANFPPYGRDFVNSRPTGRFTNGKLATDFLAEIAGVTDVLPAYLDPDFTGFGKLLKGATFGSGSSGYLDSTSRNFNTISLGEQLENFRHYRAQLVNLIGQRNYSKIIPDALFVISTGGNDFMNNYFSNPPMMNIYNILQYQELLLESLRGFVQSIYREGARRLVIIGMPPFGCLPSQITLHNLVENRCYDKFNDVAKSFNSKIVQWTDTQSLASFPGLRIHYYDIYQKAYDMIRYPSKYGFEEARKGCCGSGLIETSIFCNVGSKTCRDASKYVFWDSVHPTSTVYSLVANDLFQQLRQDSISRGRRRK